MKFKAKLDHQCCDECGKLTTEPVINMTLTETGKYAGKYGAYNNICIHLSCFTKLAVKLLLKVKHG